MPFTVSGVDSFSSKLLSIAGKVEGGVREELEDIGEDFKEKTQAVAPKGPEPHGGTLRSKAYSTVDRGPGGPSLEAGYEGPEGYLLVQHEGGWLSHPSSGEPVQIKNYTTEGTSDKFVERPWLANKARYIADVKVAVKRALKG